MTHDWIPIVSLLVSVATIWRLLWQDRATPLNKMNDRIDDIDRRVDKLTAELGVVQSKIEVFWRGVTFDMAKILHTPHPENKRRDELIEKLLEENIRDEEILEFAGILYKIKEDDAADKEERMAASILLRALERNYFIPKAGG